MQCHTTPGEHRGNTVLGEEEAAPQHLSTQGQGHPSGCPKYGVCSLCKYRCFLSAINCGKCQLLQYSHEGEIFTFITDDTGRNVL